MNIAILGYGTVGSGVDEILHENIQDVEVKHILIRKGKKATSSVMCDDINIVLQDETVDVVVEVMGGIEPAHTYILACLKAGKHVVSANKAVIAKYMYEFHVCAKEHGVKFLYEASCCGGIPWIASLLKAKRIDKIDEVRGIFNGTSNYILDHMSKEQAEFDIVLAKAQELGYAEKDPSADIDGIDIQNKLKISASLAFDYDLVQNFPTFGIRHITKTDIAYFASMKKTIKLMALAKRKGDAYYAVVEPILYAPDAMEAAVGENYNIACLHGATIGDLKFYGQGAGKLATANAVVQDILDIQQLVPHTEVVFNQTQHVDVSILHGSYVIRTNVNDASLEAILADAYDSMNMFKDSRYVHTKDIPVYQMHQYMKRIQQMDKDAFMARIDEVQI